MSLGYKNNINAAVTAVSNTFIDEYMGTASGEYVKVYLYLLRHEGENIEIPDIADALNHTEADVRRALAYWERTGVLAPERESVEEQETAVTRWRKRQKIQARGSQKTVRMRDLRPDGEK